jgi:hypothetical protein
MIMSVYRHGQGKPMPVEHHILMRMGIDKDNSAMVLNAAMQAAVTLVGLNTGEVIIKPAAEGDDDLSFELLYDQAITLVDWKRMSEQKVMTPEDLAPHLYQIVMELNMGGPLRLRLNVKAKTTTEVMEIVNRLIREDKEFQEKLNELLFRWIVADDDGTIGVGGCVLLTNVAPDDQPAWCFMEPD